LVLYWNTLGVEFPSAIALSARIVHGALLAIVAFGAVYGRSEGTLAINATVLRTRVTVVTLRIGPTFDAGAILFITFAAGTIAIGKTLDADACLHITNAPFATSVRNARGITGRIDSKIAALHYSNTGKYCQPNE